MELLIRPNQDDVASLGADEHGQSCINLSEPRPMGRGREARCAGDGDAQDKAWSQPSGYTDEYEQSRINILELMPIGRSRKAWSAGYGDS